MRLRMERGIPKPLRAKGAEITKGKGPKAKPK